MGKLPLAEGMKVILTQNYDVASGIVNGTEGLLKSVRYKEGKNGKKHAVSCIVIITHRLDESLPGLNNDEIVVLRESVDFSIRNPVTKKTMKFTRKQLPILPGYALTDYKSQGRSLDAAIIDLDSSLSLQGAYVMLSRVRSLKGVAVLRPFRPTKIENNISQELRTELDCLDQLDTTAAAIHHYGTLQYH